MIQKAKKKPVEVEVCQWIGDNSDEIFAFCGKGNAYLERQVSHQDKDNNNPWNLYICTLEGNHFASIGDYIIKGVSGEFYPCKPDIFEKTYDILK